VKVLALLVCALGLLLAQEREGNFDIRFEPTARLQTGVQVPFTVTVRDARHQPLPNAKVTLQIETKEGTDVKTFPAPGVDPGTYIAKPVFPSSGPWNVYVEVRRDNEMSARTIQFQVSE
jgi:YtkA-like